MVLNDANSQTLAERALSAFGFNPDECTLTLIKVRENTVFRADTPTGPIALRLHRPGYRTRNEIESESKLISLLADENHKVAELVPAPNGQYTVAVDHEGSSIIADAQHWLVDSRELGAIDDADGNAGLQPTQFAEMGSVAARLHSFAERLGSNHDFSRDPWDAEGLVGKNALWGDALALPGLSDSQKETLEHAREHILTKLSKYGKTPDVYGVIHADFTPENLLVHEGELAVIDFNDFADGWYLFDLATALFFFYDHPQYDAFRANLIAGYRRARDLSIEDESLLDLFIVARGFTYLGWASTRPETETAQFIMDEISPYVVSASQKLLQA